MENPGLKDLEGEGVGLVCRSNGPLEDSEQWVFLGDKALFDF